MSLSYSINQTLERARRSDGSSLATVGHDGSERTYAEFRDRVVRAASGLVTLGLKRGDVVGILALNSVEYFEYYFVCPWAGLLVSPVNIRLAAPEIAETLNDCSCKALFVDDAFLPHKDTLKETVPSLEHFIYIGKSPEAPAGTIDYKGLISEATTLSPACDVGGDDVYGIFYTGGTTGKSKGVMLTHTNLLFNAYCVINALEYKSGHRYLHCAPMFHGADQASTFALTLVGATHVFMPKFAPKATLEVIQKQKITHSLLVPTMFAMVLAVEELNQYDLSTCERFIYGASPMPESILLDAMKAFPNASFVQGYGMTECAPVNTFLSAEDHVLRRNLTSAGKAVPHAELKVVDENDNEVPIGTVGELVVRGPHVMKGYYNMPEQTAKALKNGWMHTGDGAVMDKDGYIFIKDRIKDMIVTGGENVYSTEVESCIIKMSKVAACAVIGIPDEKLVEKVAAIVVPKDNTITVEEILTHCKANIAGYKCPKEVVFREDPLPLSGAGKVLKSKLRAPYWKDVKDASIYSNDSNRRTEYQ